MTIEIIGGEVVARGKAKGTKRAAGDTPTKKKGKGETAADGEVAPAASEATPQPTPSRRSRKKAADTSTPDAVADVPVSFNAITPGHDAKLPEEPPEFTLSDLASGYLARLQASGKSKGTIASYSLELAVAMEELGKDTPVRELTEERVKAFFESERVTKTRSGRSKSPLSIAKTTRVLAQAIAWGVERGIVDAAIIPDA